MANVLLVPEPACRNFGGENVFAAKDRCGLSSEIHDNPPLPCRWEIKTGYGCQDVDANGIHANLEEDFGAHAGGRSAKGSEGCEHGAGVFAVRRDPDVQILGISRLSVDHHRVAA